MHHNQVSLSSSNLFQILQKLDSNIRLQKISKVNNVDCLSIQLTNSHFQLISMKGQIHIIVFLQKELPKEYGNCAQRSMKEEFQFLKLLNGIEGLRKPMLALVKMGREFLDLLSIIYQKINSQEDSDLIIKILTLTLKTKHLLEFSH